MRKSLPRGPPNVNRLTFDPHFDLDFMIVFLKKTARRLYENKYVSRGTAHK
jgi:hypothetical protein